jgi:hypothetical protein
MADQRTPRDRGTGGKDPEDYPSDAGPARVGKAPLPLGENSERLPAGVAPPLPPIEKRERTKMTQAASSSDHDAMNDDKEQHDRPDEAGPPREAGSDGQPRSGTIAQ